MHTGEMWQAYSLNGIALSDGGYDSALGNPEEDAAVLVGAANVWVFRKTENGVEVLFQHRSEFVDSNAGKWDISAAGHMNYGETIVEAAVREAREEIGIEISEKDLDFICACRGLTRNMLNHHFLCDWTGREDNFHFDDKEVSEVKWVPLADFDAFIDENVKDSVKTATFSRDAIKMQLEKISGNSES